MYGYIRTFRKHWSECFPQRHSVHKVVLIKMINGVLSGKKHIVIFGLNVSRKAIKCAKMNLSK